MYEWCNVKVKQMIFPFIAEQGSRKLPSGFFPGYIFLCLPTNFLSPPLSGVASLLILQKKKTTAHHAWSIYIKDPKLMIPCAGLCKKKMQLLYLQYTTLRRWLIAFSFHILIRTHQRMFVCGNPWNCCHGQQCPAMQAYNMPEYFKAPLLNRHKPLDLNSNGYLWWAMPVLRKVHTPGHYYVKAPRKVHSKTWFGRMHSLADKHTHIWRKSHENMHIFCVASENISVTQCRSQRNWML